MANVYRARLDPDRGAGSSFLCAAHKRTAGTEARTATPPAPPSTRRAGGEIARRVSSDPLPPTNSPLAQNTVCGSAMTAGNIRTRSRSSA